MKLYTDLAVWEQPSSLPQLLALELCTQTAKQHLESALEVAAKEGCAVTDWEIAEHHFKLGRVLWEMDGTSRTEPDQARRPQGLLMCDLP